MLNENILLPEVQQFIKENTHTPPAEISLKKSPFSGVSSAELATQIQARKAAKTKLPTWFATQGIYYPNKISVEQASSEVAAKYKSKLLKGNILDLTGGFGVDDFYFSKTCQSVVHCEQNAILSDIAKHNFSVLKAENISCFSGDAFAFLEAENQQFDAIFADPARRDAQAQRVFFLRDCQPNIPEKLAFLWKHTSVILIKVSPMLDIAQGIRELGCVTQIHIVAVAGEVKELLFLLKKEAKNTDIQVFTVNFLPEKIEEFHFLWKENKNPTMLYAQPQEFLYQPNAAIMKAGAWEDLCKNFNISKIAENSHLFTASDFIENFPGKTYRIKQIRKFDKKLRKEIQGISAQVTTRNFPLTASELRHKHKIKEGQELALFFTTDANDEKCVLFCQKID